MLVEWLGRRADEDTSIVVLPPDVGLVVFFFGRPSCVLMTPLVLLYRHLTRPLLK